MDEAIDHGDPRLSKVMGGPRQWPSLPFWVVLALAALALSAAISEAMAMPNCSQTVGVTAAPVPFPASGSNGPSYPSRYLEICNAHGTNTLGVNWTDGGTAAIGSTGTLTLNPGGCAWWNTPPVPNAVSVVGSATGTTTACSYQ